MDLPCLRIYRHFYWHFSSNSSNTEAAGIGGGPIINICLIIGLGYETKTSMAITYVFLIGGSIASIYSNYGKKTPNKRKNVIDANLVLMTLPMTASGSICGVNINLFIGSLQSFCFRFFYLSCIYHPT